MPVRADARRMNASAYQVALEEHQRHLAGCTRCPEMIGPVVMGEPVPSPVLLVGQAPGEKEGPMGRPFAWTAGKTMFGWFASIGMDEAAFRQRVYMAAVCRCFPGKNPKGGDRVPGPDEVARCTSWLQAELELLKPDLLIPVGKLAIRQFLHFDKLTEVIGRQHTVSYRGLSLDVVPLPHPSGASTWHRTQPGLTLLAAALSLIERHPAWRSLRQHQDLCTVKCFES